MSALAQLVRRLRFITDRHPKIKTAAVNADRHLGHALHSIGTLFPILIRPQTRKMTVAITARCNLRCLGCRYERDFMPGEQLPLAMVRNLLDDGSSLGVSTVRFYGGEPLLHPDLPEMVRYANQVGIRPYVTTNGVLLRSRFQTLYDAGLRSLSLGFYGTGERYDQYVQRPKRFSEVEGGIAAVRDRYGKAVDLQLNFLLMRPTCTLEALETAWQFAERYDMGFRIDLVHYSLPYFTEGPDRQLQFRPEDRRAIEAVAVELEHLKCAQPERLRESLHGIRSIPDWLLKGPEMRVPCDAYQMIWVGADGTVQLCYVTFRLGNLHEQRLATMLYGDKHRQAARNAFALKCPNCHCERDSRVQKHGPSRRLYSKPLTSLVPEVSITTTDCNGARNRRHLKPIGM